MDHPVKGLLFDPAPHNDHLVRISKVLMLRPIKNESLQEVWVFAFCKGFPGDLLSWGGVGTFVNLIQKSLLSGSGLWTREGDEAVPGPTARQWLPDLLTLSMTQGCPLLRLPSRALRVDEGR